MKRLSITSEEIELAEFKTCTHCLRVKTSLQLKFPRLMMQIVKILLYKKEEDLACFLTTFYEIQINEIDLKTAIMNNDYQWLNFVWVLDKNKPCWDISEGQDKRKQIRGVILESDEEGLTLEPYTFEKLFLSIQEVCKVSGSNEQTEIQKCCDWLLIFDQV